MKIEQYYIDKGYISVRKHPEFDYYVYNYTAKAQYDREWNEFTLNCRGLVLNESGDVIAKPFSKFFNYEEYGKDSNIGELPPYKTFDVYEKLDGSLGILYVTPKGELAITTRGSFESEQAKVANDILKEKYGKLSKENINTNLTYLFEIIYPENRIVVDYGDMSNLVLLTILDNKSGKDIKRSHIESFAKTWKFPIVKKYDFGSSNIISELMANNPLENSEGYVIQFNTGLRVKVKFEEYKRLHRLITGVSNKSVWEMLRAGESIEALLEKVPDEFFKWVKKTSKGFKKKYDKIEKESKKIIDILVNVEEINYTNRKDVAEYFKKHKKYQSILFAMYDNKDYKDIIWKMLRPKYSKPFKEDI